MIKKEQDRRDKKILEAYNSGEKVRFIAAMFGVYPQRVYQVLAENGIKIVRRKKTFDK